MNCMLKNVLKAGFCALVLVGFAAFSNAADDSCKEMPSCENLGYVKDLVCEQNTSISCPYDASYKKCVNNDCEELGYTKTDKKTWCKDIVPCPTDSSYTLCAKKCAGCTTGSLNPFCPFGRITSGQDECKNQCYVCAECKYDEQNGYENESYAKTSCSQTQYVKTILKPLCSKNTETKYVCLACPTGMIAPGLNSTSCVCDEANGFYRACPDGAVCNHVYSETFGTCYSPRRGTCAVNDETCDDPFDPDGDGCNDVTGYVPVKDGVTLDPHYTYAETVTFNIGTQEQKCKKVIGCSGYGGSTESLSTIDADYFNVVEHSLVNQTCYWVDGCGGQPYVPKEGTGDPCDVGRHFTNSLTYGGYTCGLCTCNVAEYYYPEPPLGRTATKDTLNYQTCYHATACASNYTDKWSDLHFDYGNYVEMPQCMEVIGCNVTVQGSRTTDFTALEKTYFTTSQASNGTYTCYYVTGCTNDKESNCNAYEELTWVSGDPKKIGGYTCGTCECNEAGGYYEQCPEGAVCTPVGRCQKTTSGGGEDFDNDGCNNVKGYVSTKEGRDPHFVYEGSSVSFYLGANNVVTCEKVKGCDSSVDGSTSDVTKIQTTYFKSAAKKLADTTCYWVAGCRDSHVVEETGECSTARGYQNTSCKDYGGKHCCLCTGLSCATQKAGSSTVSSIPNYTCTPNAYRQEDIQCYDCVCDDTHCNGTNCGTATNPCDPTVYKYAKDDHADQGEPCQVIARKSDQTCQYNDIRYENLLCHDDGTNECYKLNPSKDACIAKICNDYDGYITEAQADTTHYTYDTPKLCTGTVETTCYKKTGCNTTFNHFNNTDAGRAACLAANTCAKTCAENSFGCLAPETKKTCADDTGHTASSCDSSCFDCSDSHAYCSETCFNPVALDCRSPYPLEKCPTDHTCADDTLPVGVGNDGKTCTTKTCYKDNGCDENHEYYVDQDRCLEKNTGYKTCTNSSNSGSNCFVKQTPKTCEDYPGYVTPGNCNAEAYICTTVEKLLLGDVLQDCIKLKERGCPDDHPVLSTNKNNTCFTYAECKNYPSGTKTINCCTTGVDKTCEQQSNSYYTLQTGTTGCTGYNSGYKCSAFTTSCGTSCYKTDGCDSTHCGYNGKCNYTLVTCSSATYPYAYTISNGQGTNCCTPYCTGSAVIGTTICSAWQCNSGYCKSTATSGVCSAQKSCNNVTVPSYGTCKSGKSCTPKYADSSGVCTNGTPGCEEWVCADSTKCRATDDKCYTIVESCGSQYKYTSVKNGSVAGNACTPRPSNTCVLGTTKYDSFSCNSGTCIAPDTATENAVGSPCVPLGESCGTESKGPGTEGVDWSCTNSCSERTGTPTTKCSTKNVCKEWICLKNFTKYNDGCYDCTTYKEANGWYAGSNKPSGCYTATDTKTCAGVTYTKYVAMSTSCPDTVTTLYGKDRSTVYYFKKNWKGSPTCACSLQVKQGSASSYSDITSCGSGSSALHTHGSNASTCYNGSVTLDNNTVCEGYLTQSNWANLAKCPSGTCTADKRYSEDSCACYCYETDLYYSDETRCKQVQTNATACQNSGAGGCKYVSKCKQGYKISGRTCASCSTSENNSCNSTYYVDGQAPAGLTKNTSDHYTNACGYECYKYTCNTSMRYYADSNTCKQNVTGAKTCTQGSNGCYYVTECDSQYKLDSTNRTCIPCDPVYNKDESNCITVKYQTNCGYDSYKSACNSSTQKCYRGTCVSVNSDVCPDGYTLGATPTGDCYNYSTDTSSNGHNCYKKGTFKCNSDMHCDSGVCTNCPSTKYATEALCKQNHVTGHRMEGDLFTASNVVTLTGCYTCSYGGTNYYYTRCLYETENYADNGFNHPLSLEDDEAVTLYTKGMFGSGATLMCKEYGKFSSGPAGQASTGSKCYYSKLQITEMETITNALDYRVWTDSTCTGETLEKQP